MDYKVLVEAHKGIIYLFLLSITIKAVLLFVNDSLFQKFRKKTKIVEIILGPLILITGFILIFQGDWLSDMQTWLLIKIIIVFLLLPVIIIGFRKGNKAMVLIAVIGFYYIFFVARNKNLFFSEATPVNGMKNHAMVMKNAPDCPVVISEESCSLAHQIANEPKEKGFGLISTKRSEILNKLDRYADNL